MSKTEITWQNPLPQGSRLYDVYVIGNDTAIAVGAAGTIIRTIVRGQTWELIESGIRKHLKTVSFTDARHGCITGDGGTILMTYDGGSSWDKRYTGLPDSVSLVYQFFLNSIYGWVRSDEYHILRTTDSGETWETTEYTDVFDPGRHARLLYFTDSANGVALWGSPLLTTVDGGKTWQGKGIESTPHDIHMLDSINWWLPGKHIQRSRDGGKTWGIEYESENILYNIHMVDTLYGWAAGGWNTIEHTKSGANGWSNYKSPIVDSSGYIVWESVHCYNRAHGYIVGTFGNILKITDNGGNLDLISHGFHDYMMNDIFALDSMTCYAVGQYGNYVNNDTVRGTIYKTTDGGAHWEKCFDGRHQLAYDASLQCVYFIDDNTGWVAGANGRVLKTTDGGNTWKEYSASTNGILYDIFFVNDSIGYACGKIDSSDIKSAGVYCKTTDGGKTWKHVVYGNILFNSLHFFSPDTGYMSSNIALYKTVDGAQSWDTIKTLPTILWLEVDFVDRDVCYASGDRGVIYKSLDGCNTWIKTNSDKVTSEGIIDLYATSKDTAYACGGAGMLIKTEDGGENWEILNNNHCEHMLVGLHFGNERNGWVVGKYSTIMKITEKEDISPIKKKRNKNK